MRINKATVSVQFETCRNNEDGKGRNFVHDIQLALLNKIIQSETVQAASEVQLEGQQQVPQFTTAPQCRCKDIDACTEEMLSKITKCKVS